MSKKDETIIIRVTKEIKDDIIQAAGELGLNISSYLIYLFKKFGGKDK